MEPEALVGVVEVSALKVELVGVGDEDWSGGVDERKQRGFVQLVDMVERQSTR